MSDYQRVRAKEANTKHGMCTTSIYKVWIGIGQRCYNENNPGYKNYGGRGIKMCEEWKTSFDSFLKWAMSNGYKSGLVIDRINNDSDYCPENCQWITQKENCQPGKKRKPKNNTSGYTGVSMSKKNGKYIAYIQANGKTRSKRYFDTAEDALKQRIKFEIEIYGKQVCNLEQEGE